MIMAISYWPKMFSMEKNFGVASNQINVKNFCGMMEIHIALIQMGQFNVSSTIQLRDITNLKMIAQCVVKINAEKSPN